MISRNELQRNLERVHEGRLFEVRALNPARGSWKTASGYFTDPKLAADCIATLDAAHEPESIYMTFNDLHPGCYSRAPDRIITSPRYTTQDTDVVGRRYVLVDLDPVRPAGVSSSDEELERCRLLWASANSLLRQDGYRGIITAMSGNGYHLLIPESKSELTEGFVRWMLRRLGCELDTEHCTVDQSVYNLSRITKVYGSYARKGFSTDDRPHRRSCVVDVAY